MLFSRNCSFTSTALSSHTNTKFILASLQSYSSGLLSIPLEFYSFKIGIIHNSKKQNYQNTVWLIGLQVAPGWIMLQLHHTKDEAGALSTHIHPATFSHFSFN